MVNIGVGLRAVAAIIDTFLLFIIGYLIALVSGETSPEGFHLQGVPFIIWLVIALAYYIIQEARFGTTVGKRLIGLKVVKIEGGGPIDMRTSIVRNVLRLVDGLLFYLVGAVVIWFSDKKQRLGDKVAGTVVVRAE